MTFSLPRSTLTSINNRHDILITSLQIVIQGCVLKRQNFVACLCIVLFIYWYRLELSSIISLALISFLPYCISDFLSPGLCVTSLIISLWGAHGKQVLVSMGEASFYPISSVHNLPISMIFYVIHMCSLKFF